MNIRYRPSARAAIALSALAVLGCDDRSPTGPGDNGLLARYVAIGNSVTAGWQSGGISRATQLDAYPALIAGSVRTTYRFAGLGAGCPPPVTSLTQALGTDRPAVVCAATIEPSGTTLNNVAVPGATVADLSRSMPGQLSQQILGGQSQVDRALETGPGFVSIWIGNNDVLQPALFGVLSGGTSEMPLPGMTSAAAFAADYARVVDPLFLAGADHGVLLGVTDVTQLPIFIPASALSDPFVRLALNAVAGTTVGVDTGCAGSSSLVSLGIIPAIRSGTHPATIFCEPQPIFPGFPAILGDIWVLDAAEQQALTTRVAAYNAYIQAKADTVGYAYYDPNILFANARAAGEIPVVPNLANQAAPFGPMFSLDGAHPSSMAHALIANGVIGAINARYSTRIREVPVSGS